MMDRAKRRDLSLASWALLALGLALAACAATEQTRDLRYSGFLKNYAQLSPGQRGQAMLVYVNPDADFSAYDKIIIDPVTVWRTMGSNIPSLTPGETEQLASYLYWATRKRLENDYEIVKRPGRGVLRLRLAITEAKGSNVTMDVISKVSPLPIVTGVTKLATGTRAFVGEAGVEAEILDSLSHHRLAAAMDERAGGRTLQGAGNTWTDVHDAFDHWAERMQTRLAELRTGAAE
jgi:hypothetical protein